MNFLAEEWTETFPYQLLVGTGVALMALLLLAAVSFQCSSTWQWLMRVRRHMKEEDAEDWRGLAATGYHHKTVGTCEVANLITCKCAEILNV